MSQPTLISAQGLSVHYALRGGLIGPKPYVGAVENVDIEIASGSFFGLVGESGSGKTTLLRTIAGLEDPDGLNESDAAWLTKLARKYRQ